VRAVYLASVSAIGPPSMAGAGRNQLRRIRTTPVAINQRMKASSAGVDVPPGGNQAQTRFAMLITRPIQAKPGG
jgi:hypothetical protein